MWHARLSFQSSQHSHWWQFCILGTTGLFTGDNGLFHRVLIFRTPPHTHTHRRTNIYFFYRFEIVILIRNIIIRKCSRRSKKMFHLFISLPLTWQTTLHDMCDGIGKLTDYGVNWRIDWKKEFLMAPQSTA